MPDTTMSNAAENCTTVIEKAKQGRLTVFLGAGANYAQQPAGRNYGAQADFLPTGGELASFLAEQLGYQPQPEIIRALDCHAPAKNACDSTKTLRTLVYGDLSKVSQQVQINNPGKLKDELYTIFSRSYRLTPLHKALARLARLHILKAAPVFITTNYDTMMEHALADAGVPFDVLYYSKTRSGNQAHWLYHLKEAHGYYNANDAKESLRSNPACRIVDLAQYSDLPLTSPARALVVKIHGTVSPAGEEFSSFVISQDDYIDFLRLVPAAKPLPTTLSNHLIDSHFLFLGYGLGDWNILAILQNLWAQRTGDFENWAVLFDSTREAAKRWDRGDNKIEVINGDVGAYGEEMQQLLDASQP